ncbi:Multidrug resistance-associated protein 1, partial [Biomphalaria glabrata]
MLIIDTSSAYVVVQFLRKKETDTRLQNGYASFDNSGKKTDSVKLSTGEKTPLLNRRSNVRTSLADDTARTNEKEKDNEDHLVQASLFKVLVKTYGIELLNAQVCKFVYDLLQFVSPLLLSTLIQYTQEKLDNPSQTHEWKGYVYASSFFVVSMAGSIMFNQNFHLGMTLGMRIKAALIAAVYKK